MVYERVWEGFLEEERVGKDHGKGIPGSTKAQRDEPALRVLSYLRPSALPVAGPCP